MKTKLSRLIKKFEKKKLELPAFEIGNKMRIGFFIQEGNKKRVQFFEGILISKTKTNSEQRIKLRKFTSGIGVEKTFPLFSPKIHSVKSLNKSKSKKAKLFFLRKRIGKAALRF